MNHPPRIGCLIMAAGNASRFGSNKLAAKVDGKMLIEHALETVAREEFASVTVVTQYDEVLVLARRFGFTVLVNPFPEWGASHTVRLGTEAMADCDAILYQVADQPLLRRESVRAEVEFSAGIPTASSRWGTAACAATRASSPPASSPS